MPTIRSMLDAHPRPSRTERDALAACVEACFDCAQACTACADACLGEARVQEFAACIRLNLDCFDVCVATGNVLSRQTEPPEALLRAQLQACAVACRTCGDECRRHAEGMGHCLLCAEMCDACEAACSRLLAAA
jgi:hypothetical protein